MFVQIADIVVVSRMGKPIEIAEHNLAGQVIGNYIVQDPEVNLFTVRVRFEGDYYSPQYDKVWKESDKHIPEGYNLLTTRKTFGTVAVVEYRYYCKSGMYKYIPKEQ